MIPIAANILPGRYDPRVDVDQQPLLFPEQESIALLPLQVTTTFHSTKTLYHFSVATTTRTRYTIYRSTNVPYAVQIWHAGQSQACCDLTVVQVVGHGMDVGNRDHYGEFPFLVRSDGAPNVHKQLSVRNSTVLPVWLLAIAAIELTLPLLHSEGGMW